MIALPELEVYHCGFGTPGRPSGPHPTSGFIHSIKQAIDVYYDRVKGDKPRAYEIFQESGFIGIGEAVEDLSTRYKDYLTETLEEKHGLR